MTIKQSVKINKLTDDGSLKLSSEKILEQALKKAGSNAQAVLDRIRTVSAKYVNAK